MARVKLLLRMAAAAMGGLLYLWFAGVLNAARAKRRRRLKAAARKRA